MTARELQIRLQAAQPPTLLHVLPPEVFAATRIPGSLTACVYEMTFLDQVRALASDASAPIVVYGAGEGSLDAATASEKLRAAGYAQVQAFDGGRQGDRGQGTGGGQMARAAAVLTLPAVPDIMPGDEPAASLRRNDHPELSRRPAQPDEIMRGQQAATREWWDHRRNACELFVSQFVDIEAERGDADMVRARIAALDGLPRLPVTESVRELASEILGSGLIAMKAAVDASQIAVAAVPGMDMLLSGTAQTFTTSKSAGSSNGFARAPAGRAPLFARRSIC
jgi:rhodanese-related sulfurtransferase